MEKNIEKIKINVEAIEVSKEEWESYDGQNCIMCDPSTENYGFYMWHTRVKNGLIGMDEVKSGIEWNGKYYILTGSYNKKQLLKIFGVFQELLKIGRI